jgi:hypothetical protein
MIFYGGEEYKIVGKGNVQIEMESKKLFFLYVFFVPILDKNLPFIIEIMMHNPHFFYF